MVPPSSSQPSNVHPPIPYKGGKEPMYIDPTSQPISRKNKCNQHAHNYRKNYQDCVKSCMHVSHYYSPSLDQHIFVEEVNHTNEIGKCDIHILGSISINLDEEDTLDDDEHGIIDPDVDFPNILSTRLSLISELDYHNSHEVTYSKLAIVHAFLDVSPLACFPHSLNTKDHN